MHESQLVNFIQQSRRYMQVNLEEAVTRVVVQGVDLSLYKDLLDELTPSEIVFLAAMTCDRDAISQTPFTDELMGSSHNATALYKTVVSVERGATSNSKSPMWTMQTDDNIKFWVFEHADVTRNTINFFDDAGWGSILRQMPIGQKWTFSGLQVQLESGDSGYQRPVYVKTKTESDTYHEAKPEPTDKQNDKQKAVSEIRSAIEVG